MTDGDGTRVAFDPADPQTPAGLRALAAEFEQRMPLGEVHVFVHGLDKGSSEVRVGGDGATELELIDAAIAELKEAREIFADGGQGRTEPG